MSHPAFEEFVGFLNSRRARYLIVGAYAVAHHGFPRATVDLDVWVKPSVDNARRVLGALADLYRGHDFGILPERLAARDKILTFGEKPVQVDVITSIGGVPDFDEAWRHGAVGAFGGVRCRYISLEDLIRAKAAVVNRPGREDKGDERDLRVLRKALERQRTKRAATPTSRGAPRRKRRE